MAVYKAPVEPEFTRCVPFKDGMIKRFKFPFEWRDSAGIVPSGTFGYVLSELLALAPISLGRKRKLRQHYRNKEVISPSGVKYVKQGSMEYIRGMRPSDESKRCRECNIVAVVQNFKGDLCPKCARGVVRVEKLCDLCSRRPGVNSGKLFTRATADYHDAPKNTIRITEFIAECGNTSKFSTRVCEQCVLKCNSQAFTDDDRFMWVYKELLKKEMGIKTNSIRKKL